MESTRWKVLLIVTLLGVIVLGFVQIISINETNDTFLGILTVLILAVNAYTAGISYKNYKIERRKEDFHRLFEFNLDKVRYEIKIDSARQKVAAKIEEMKRELESTRQVQVSDQQAVNSIQRAMAIQEANLKLARQLAVEFYFID